MIQKICKGIEKLNKYSYRYDFSKDGKTFFYKKRKKSMAI